MNQWLSEVSDQEVIDAILSVPEHFLFQAGYNKGVSFQVNGAGANTSINVTEHSWAEEIERANITHSGTLGLQALLACVLKGTGNVKAQFDSTAMPFATAPGIKAGVSGLLTFNLGAPNTQFIAPVMVVKVNYQTAIQGNGTVKYDFDVEMNCLSGASQAALTYTYPT